MILTYISEFDKINYPLVLSYEEISDIKSLKKIVDNLNKKNEGKNEIVFSDNFNENDLEDIINENKELKIKMEEIQKGLNNMNNESYLEEKLGAVEREKLYSKIEKLKQEKEDMIEEQKQEIIMLCSKIEKLSTENVIKKNKIDLMSKKSKKKNYKSHYKILEEKNKEITKLKKKINFSKENEMKLKKEINSLKDELKLTYNKLKIKKKTKKSVYRINSKKKKK